MFDIGFWELMLLAVIGLIVLGPERLPVVARALGRWAGKARHYAGALTSELEKEVDTQGLRDEVHRTREQIESDTRDIRASAEEAVEPIRHADRTGREEEGPRDSKAGGQGQQTAAAKADDDIRANAEMAPGNEATTRQTADETAADDQDETHESRR